MDSVTSGVFGWVFANKEWLFSGLMVPIVLGSLALGVDYIVGFKSRRQVSGRWLVSLLGEGHSGPHGEMTLRQFGRRVWGSCQVHSTLKGQCDFPLKFMYVGVYQENQVVMRFWQKGDDLRMVGATCLMLPALSKEIKGSNLFWDHRDIKWTTNYFVLKKIS